MTMPDVKAVRRKASGSSFYAAMRLMAKPQREAMFAIYGFCRAVDDIADDGIGSREERRAELNLWRKDVTALCRRSDPGRAAFLAPVVEQFHPRLEDFLAVIDGMQMDVDCDIVAPPLEVLELYCDCVASAVGRLSIKVFGMEEEPGFALAHHLGRALQLTNILRDLDEDAAVHRLYVPREYLNDAGFGAVEPHAAVENPAIDNACCRVALLARTHYDEAERILRNRPTGDVRAPRLMAAVYSEILRLMQETGWAPPRRRVHIPKTQLAWLALRHSLSP